MISTGTGSASMPEKTVQAVAIMPGLISARWKISTLPALGRDISAADARVARARKPAANQDFMRGEPQFYYLPVGEAVLMDCGGEGSRRRTPGRVGRRVATEGPVAPLLLAKEESMLPALNPSHGAPPRIQPA